MSRVVKFFFVILLINLCHKFVNSNESFDDNNEKCERHLSMFSESFDARETWALKREIISAKTKLIK